MEWPMDKTFVQNKAPQARFLCEETAGGKIYQ